MSSVSLKQLLSLFALLQGGQHDLPIHRGSEQLRWFVGYDKVPLGGVCARDDKCTAAASDPGRIQTVLYSLLQPIELSAESG